MAKIALLRTLLKESETHFKIEEGGSWEIWNKGDNTKSPQGWIQLHPYEYRHVVKDDLEGRFEIIPRKLFARFATNKEKIVGKLSVDHLVELFVRSSLIWKAQAEKNEDLKHLITEKLESFKNK